MMHLAAYYTSIANTAADQQINALTDSMVQIRDNAFITPDKMRRVILAAFFGTNLTVAKLKPASYRNFGDYWVEPLGNAVGGAGAITPALNLTDLPEHGAPLILDSQEELPAYGQQGSGGAQDAYAVVIFSDGKPPKREGKFFTVRGTGTTTLNAKAWTLCPITMDTGLPAGRYNLVGARAKSTGILAFRFAFTEQINRPGGLGNQNDTAFTQDGQRNGAWGVWGSFDHLSIPQLEVLSTSADTAETVWMDVEKVA